MLHHHSLVSGCLGYMWHIREKLKVVITGVSGGVLREKCVFYGSYGSIAKCLVVWGVVLEKNSLVMFGWYVIMRGIRKCGGISHFTPVPLSFRKKRKRQIEWYTIAKFEHLIDLLSKQNLNSIFCSSLR